MSLNKAFVSSQILCRSCHHIHEGRIHTGTGRGRFVNMMEGSHGHECPEKVRVAGSMDMFALCKNIRKLKK